ncbi:transcription elongation factor A protein 3 isoform X2 [Microcaecilia unicolor]|uniref:Transcription elongation factor A protein 3 isoform X2 n=1 Tax=Microcaecilia unicolor TaxID=1415580 RepID=A0A6P7ZGP2_9AMPH|nr:transcription elongation factor A protein 3 isoform X2 [Microcaecilia unicolor]
MSLSLSLFFFHFRLPGCQHLEPKWGKTNRSPSICSCLSGPCKKKAPKHRSVHRGAWKWRSTMGREEDLLKIAKKLDKMVSRSKKNLEGALDLLKELNSYSMTLQLLQSTRIGVTVNAVRKHCSDEEVVAMAKILIKNWKRLLDSSGPQKEEKEKERHKVRKDKEKEKRLELPGWRAIEESMEVCTSPTEKHKERRDSADSRSSSCISSPSSSSPKKRLSTERRHSSSSNPAASPAGSLKSSSDEKEERPLSLGSGPVSSPPGSRKNSIDGREERPNDLKLKNEAAKTPTSPLSPSFSPTICFLSPCYLTGDSIRDKCIEMLSAALKHNEDYREFGTNCDQVASEIEDHIYQELKVTDMKYRNRVRSRISNLKDPKNPNLRRNVLCGSISTERIARMTAEEMASDELKELRNAMTQEAIREHQMAKTGGTQTDLFQCSKCKKKNCSYNQVQTRSADEPMTTFVLCNECGNRWKFC